MNRLLAKSYVDGLRPGSNHEVPLARQRAAAIAAPHVQVPQSPATHAEVVASVMMAIGRVAAIELGDDFDRMQGLVRAALNRLLVDDLTGYVPGMSDAQHAALWATGVDPRRGPEDDPPPEAG